MKSKIKEQTQQWMSTRTFKKGQTIQHGWFWFFVANDENPPEITTLDFKKMASFTTDFSEVERINALQEQTLSAAGVAGSAVHLDEYGACFEGL